MPDPDPEDVDFDAEFDSLDLTMRMTAALTAATDPNTYPATALLPASLVYRADALAHPRSFAAGHLRKGPGTTAMKLLLSRIGTPPEFNESVHALCEGLALREVRGELPGGVAVWSVGVEALLRGWGLLGDE
ncbi:Uncharacterised protein [Mycobacteroides abscessus subsp. abscessus]|uniref:hypothetical protein n=1 Tax=Mycobacteroides abscessus TaxID=36809 RepID=UPI000926EEEE|nr:hypothetical protein [Mycobacteroides abscessus]SHX67407.1 Uncharacterised protein [Mycobacteroides abscessus subsp. abscessus]SIC59086.1 Uncharacterised protein [Mycobacteroides abscessus subsp. abscessus]SKK19921.1 Uncharacterised protein [Mycobacteroides abscessus subsp. abscessus]SKP49795.1 Uncharacterised protein [Mycobacteroides abscessus subsp. abscessus]SKR42167.1 Uncharacterised protein [Mycobacteroides abscessus subsp. abscessus]